MTKSGKRVIALTFIENIIGNATQHVLHKEQKTNLASFRLQLHPALMACQQLGHSVEIWSLHNTHPEHINQMGTADLCIVGKMSSNNEESINQITMINLAALARFKRNNTPIALIYSDHHCQKDDTIGNFHKDMTSLSSHIITPSKKIAELLAPLASTNLQFSQINDPWHFEQINEFKKKLNPNSQLNLLWFGSTSNIKYLIDIMPSLLKNVQTFREIRLTVLSSKSAFIQFTESINLLKKSKQKWKVIFREWNPKLQPLQLRSELDKAHITLLPSDPEDPSKAGVSHNRFVDAVRGATIPVASPMTSYLELSELGLIGTNFPEMIHFAEKNYCKITEHIKIKRDEKLEQFSPTWNLTSWSNLVRKIIC